MCPTFVSPSKCKDVKECTFTLMVAIRKTKSKTVLPIPEVKLVFS